MRFHVAAIYCQAGIALPAIRFLELALFRCGIDDPEQHEQLPTKLTPLGLPCFRDGA